MTLPSRGTECKHLQCFDLESYLKANGEGGLWKCPVCNKNLFLEGLEIDQFTWSIVQTQRFAEADEVSIDPAANVRVIFPSGGGIKSEVKTEVKSEVKTEPGMTSSDPSASLPMSPGSLKLPNLALWEIPTSTRSPALYAPPDINSELKQPLLCRELSNKLCLSCFRYCERPVSPGGVGRSPVADERGRQQHRPTKDERRHARRRAHELEGENVIHFQCDVRTHIMI